MASFEAEQRFWKARALVVVDTGSIVVHMGLVALQYVGSSQIRDQTGVLCLGRWILYHWTTRKVLFLTKLLILR